MNNIRVILLHGYNKDESDMYSLGEVLEDEGYLVDYLNMPLTYNNIEESISMLKDLLLGLKGSGVDRRDEIILIGHSMGGLVIRGALAEKRIRKIVDKVVLISTPNNGSKLARTAYRYLPFFPKIFKPLKIFIDNHIELYTGKDVEIGAIAGSEPELFLGRFLDEMSDGRVEVEEVKMKKLKDFIVLPLNHKDIHQKYGTARYISNFIKRSSFKTD